MTTIFLPRSVLDYAAKPAIRTAVDHLLATGADSIPEDLDDWSQVRAYHAALLSACQVRSEHALLMIDICEAIWVPLFVASKTVGKPLTPLEQSNWAFVDPSPQALWGEGYPFHRTFHYPALPGSIVDAAIRYDFDQGVSLRFAVWNLKETGATSDVMDLPDPWEPEPNEDGYRVTRPGQFIPSRDETNFDLSELIAAAASIVSLL